MANRFSIEGILKARDSMTGMLARVEGRVGKFGRTMKRFGGEVLQVGNLTTRSFTGMMGPLTGVGLGLGAVTAAAAAATAGVLATGAALKLVVSTGADFEHAIVSAAVKFDPAIRKGTAAFEELRVVAEDVGARTEFSASQAAAGLRNLASSGFTARQAIAALPGLVDLGTAAETDLGQASEIAAGALGAFGLKVEDTIQLSKNLTRVSDAMSATADRTNADMAGLYQTIQEGGPIAKSAGQSIETFLALSGGLADIGITGSVAGTTLKNTFLAMAAPTAEAGNALKKLGIKTQDASGNVLDALDIMDQLRAKTEKLGTAERTGVLEQIFGRIPLAGVTALLEITDKTRELRTALEGAGGSTAIKAGILRDDTKGSLDELSSAVEGLEIAIFGMVSGPVRDAIKVFTDWAGANRELVSSKVGEFVARFSAVVQAAEPFLRSFIDGFVEGFGEAWPSIKGALVELGSAFTSVFGGSAGTTIKDFAVTLGKVTAAAVGVATVVGGVLVGAALLLGKAWTLQIGFITGAWDLLIGGIAKVIMWFDTLSARVAYVFEYLMGFIPQGAKDVASSLIDGLVNGIKSGARWVLDAIKNLGSSAVGALKSLLGISSPSRVFAGLGEATGDGFAKGVEASMPATIEAPTLQVPTLPKMPSLSRFDDVMAAPAGWALPPDMGAPTSAGREPAPALAPSAALATDRMARTMSETRSETTDRAEVTVKAEPGTKARVTKQAKRTPIKLTPSGAL